MAKKTVHLSWVDETGECYHEQDLAPAIAKEQLRRGGMFFIDIPGVSYNHTLASFSRAEVARSNRGLIAKGTPHLDASKQKRVLITLTEDQ